MPTRIERIAFPCEFRVEGKGADQKIVGYAARFNELSKILWRFKEKINPGAFTEALKNGDVRALFNHSADFVLGRQSAGTLKLWEDESGLRYEITPPDTQDVRDLMVRMLRGDIKESSFSFQIAKDGDSWDESSEPWIRTIKRVETLYDVGPVTFPAYPTASSGVRNFEEVLADHQAILEQRTKSVELEQKKFFSLSRLRLDLADK